MKRVAASIVLLIGAVWYCFGVYHSNLLLTFGGAALLYAAGVWLAVLYHTNG